MLKNYKIYCSLFVFGLLNEQVNSAVLPSKSCKVNEVDQPLDHDCPAMAVQNNTESDQKLRPARQACLDAYPAALPTLDDMTALSKKFPYMVAIGWKTSQHDSYGFHCGGVLISPNFVLSAAHCSSFGGVSPTVVLPGGLNLTDPSAMLYNIAEFVKHPDYHEKSSYNDIALLRLSQAIDLKSMYMKPVCLWQKSGVPENSTATAIGYGALQFAGQSSEHLVKTHLMPVAQEQCEEFYANSSDVEQGILRTQICLEDQRNLSDTCQGDSGGPVILDEFEDEDKRRRPHVIGVTSAGLGCAFNSPGVYARVSEYVPWIESIVWS